MHKGLECQVKGSPALSPPHKFPRPLSTSAWLLLFQPSLGLLPSSISPASRDWPGSFRPNPNLIDLAQVRYPVPVQSVKAGGMVVPSLGGPSQG